MSSQRAGLCHYQCFSTGLGLLSGCSELRACPASIIPVATATPAAGAPACVTPACTACVAPAWQLLLQLLRLPQCCTRRTYSISGPPQVVMQWTPLVRHPPPASSFPLWHLTGGRFLVNSTGWISSKFHWYVIRETSLPWSRSESSTSSTESGCQSLRL